ncbi:hypothetical protein SAMN05421775_1257, partial [Jannaschia aquimarina]
SKAAARKLEMSETVQAALWRAEDEQVQI